MDSSRVWTIVPYLVMLAIAVLLFVVAGQIQFSGRPGQLGPDFWPKLALGLVIAASSYEILRRLFGSRDEPHGIADALDDEEGEEEAPRVPALLLGGVLLTLAFGLAITTLGFVLSTFIFLVAFMYLGRYRSHLAIWLSSAIGTLALALVFLKVVYVSLPRGAPPFDRLTDAIVGLF